MKIITLILAVILCSCTGGEVIRNKFQPGMAKGEVVKLLGKPDGYSNRDGVETLQYTDLRVSGWGNAKADYRVSFKDGKLVEYGTGDVRENRPNMMMIKHF